MLDACHEMVGAIRPLRREEYDRLVALGVFAGEKLELLDGVLVTMSPQGPEHAGVIQILTELLVSRLDGRASVRVQLSLATAEISEPEPDLAVVASGDYRQAHPTTGLLVIEVAVTSQPRDRLKMSQYAGCGVPECWVVDLADDLVQVHTEPAEGSYQRVATFTRDDTISLQAFPDISLEAREFLGPLPDCGR